MEDEDERNRRFWPARRRQQDPDEDDRVLRIVRADPPSFEGSLGPRVYLDWEAGMDRYFEWYDMPDQRRVRFAKMRLLGRVQTYWMNVENLVRQ